MGCSATMSPASPIRSTTTPSRNVSKTSIGRSRFSRPRDTTVSNLQLVTAPIAGGVLQQAQIFAEQASAAGVNVSISQITPTAFFGSEYLQRTFTQDNWLYGLYFTQVALSTVPSAPYNETHFDDPSYTALFEEALRTVDYAKQTEIAHEMQLIEYETGGNIIPNFTPCFDAHTKSLQGIEGSKVGLPSWAYCFKTCWFD